MQKQIHQTWFFEQGPEAVWEYLTKPELIEQWLMKNDFQPVVGRHFTFTFPTNANSKYEGIVHCEVLEVSPFNKLSYTWNGRTYDQSRRFESTVEWLLIPQNGGTELQIKHDGFEMMEDVLSHSSGWEACLKKINELITAKYV